jgi:alkanesulfonate monooxygenase SsuD/methylene tetrahydromethanopterin reductase-like flavin-dependent oxidoreductase (luciferase family)
MQIGAFYFPTDYGTNPGELARELEAHGFESLFVCEHTHIPVSRTYRIRSSVSRAACRHASNRALSFALTVTFPLTDQNIRP